jgi:hypothetical protein
MDINSGYWLVILNNICFAYAKPIIIICYGNGVMREKRGGISDVP